ncbi:MAG: ferredoxin [Gammaproteobacteria bacterium]|jgi:ferredoxin
MSDAPAATVEAEFQIKIASTGAIFDVPKNKSIVEILWDNGFDVDTSCESGLCATCMTGYTEGEPDHQDSVLDDDERTKFLCVCVSRSSSPLLVLDL